MHTSGNIELNILQYENVWHFYKCTCHLSVANWNAQLFTKSFCKMYKYWLIWGFFFQKFWWTCFDVLTWEDNDKFWDRLLYQELIMIFTGSPLEKAMAADQLTRQNEKAKLQSSFISIYWNTHRMNLVFVDENNYFLCYNSLYSTTKTFNVHMYP